MRDNYKIYKYLEDAIKKNVPDAILLSGGIDSTAIAYLAKKYNSNLECITVANKNVPSPDVKFAKMAAKNIGIKKHSIYFMEEKEIERLIKKVVIALGSFNIYWVSAALVLYKGLEIASKKGNLVVATGEGADDLFGSFPVMLGWKHGKDELADFIAVRMKDIDLMTEKVANSVGGSVFLPFHDSSLKKYALKIPISERIFKKSNGEKITKFPLRKAFEKKLPKKIVSRPQTMAFTGASTLDYLIKKYENYAKISLYKKKYNIDFKNSFECFLFDILNDSGGYRPLKNSKNKCLYCGSKLRSSKSVHCVVCGTLQYKNKILQF